MADRKSSCLSKERACRPRKRTFSGSQCTKGDDAEEPGPSASRRKLRTSDDFIPALNNRFLYVLLEFFGVFDALSEYVKCNNCVGKVSFDMSGVRGLGFNIVVNCDQRCRAPPLISSCPV